MSKPFQTHNQQLKILRSRNISITNGGKAKAILIRENYYQLINGYKHIFLDLRDPIHLILYCKTLAFALQYT